MDASISSEELLAFVLYSLILLVDSKERLLTAFVCSLLLASFPFPFSLQFLFVLLIKLMFFFFL